MLACIAFYALVSYWGCAGCLRIKDWCIIHIFSNELFQWHALGHNLDIDLCIYALMKAWTKCFCITWAKVITETKKWHPKDKYGQKPGIASTWMMPLGPLRLCSTMYLCPLSAPRIEGNAGERWSNPARSGKSSRLILFDTTCKHPSDTETTSRERSMDESQDGGKFMWKSGVYSYLVSVS